MDDDKPGDDDGQIRVKPHPQCLLTELEDGTGVVLNLETKFYHSLNTTAAWLWKALDAGAVTKRELTGKLVEEFQVDEERAFVDIQVALEQFERDGLLIPVEPPRVR